MQHEARPLKPAGLAPSRTVSDTSLDVGAAGRFGGESKTEIN
ncbi:hypothetical protein ANO14919_078870 [Xylariales sp. No.14919]|nr:hypothetical protein ANO14919_078870 [Xylariales sp. No.14919]